MLAEITKDTGSEGNFSEEDYMDSRRSGGGGGRSHHQPHYEPHHRGQRPYGQRPSGPQHHGATRNPQRRDERLVKCFFFVFVVPVLVLFPSSCCKDLKGGMYLMNRLLCFSFKSYKNVSNNTIKIYLLM